MLAALKDFLFSAMASNEAVHAQGQNHELATASLLVQLSFADRSMDEAEHRAMCKALAHLFELSDSEAQALVKQASEHAQHAVSLYEFTKSVKLLDYDLRYQLIVALWQVAYADAHIDPHEEALIRQISDLLYLRHSDYIKARHAVKAHE